MSVEYPNKVFNNSEKPKLPSLPNYALRILCSRIINNLNIKEPYKASNLGCVLSPSKTEKQQVFDFASIDFNKIDLLPIINLIREDLIQRYKEGDLDSLLCPIPRSDGSSNPGKVVAIDCKGSGLVVFFDKDKLLYKVISSTKIVDLINMNSNNQTNMNMDVKVIQENIDRELNFLGSKIGYEQASNYYKNILKRAVSEKQTSTYDIDVWISVYEKIKALILDIQ